MDGAKWRFYLNSLDAILRAVIFIYLQCNFVYADPWRDLLLPNKAAAVVVADQIDIQQIPTRIWKFHDDVPPEQFLGFYRKAWATPSIKNAPPYIENTAGQWKIISRAENDYLIAVQVDVSNAWVSDGMISVAQLKGPLIDVARIQKTPEYPKMPGSTVMQELINHDPGKNALTVFLENGSSPQSNRNFYKKYYEQHGWVEIGSNVASGANQSILLLQKGPLETSFTFVMQGSKTQVVGSIQYPES